MCILNFGCSEKNTVSFSNPFVVASVQLRLFTVRSLGHHNFSTTTSQNSFHPLHNNFNLNMIRSISHQQTQLRPLVIRLALRGCSASACRAQSRVVAPLACREQFIRRASSSPPAPKPKAPKFGTCTSKLNSLDHQSSPQTCSNRSEDDHLPHRDAQDHVPGRPEADDNLCVRLLRRRRHPRMCLSGHAPLVYHRM